ncbi:MAG: hypothetical protein SFV15_24100 [Polyangiaceae bacterium]|nr:hypothetical protein [Polyangiaceae bacterium]
MSCCGNKRAQWKREALGGPAPDAARAEPSGVEHEKERAPKRFQYIGESSLTLTGTFSRQTYYFETNGAVVEVDYQDSFAFRAERDLKPL